MSYRLASTEAPFGNDDPPSQKPLAFNNVIGWSPALLEAIDFARRVAARRLTTVLIVGETGTGKGLFARGIHYAGPDGGEPFVPVNCAAIPGSLLESELFGHEAGAFTDARSRKTGLMELAGSGTLFLDEISEIPLNLQPKLLRALEERRFRRVGGVDEIDVSCRIIAATNTRLEDAVTDGRFREDLFYRLNVLRVSLPPLRQREGDPQKLAEHFIREIAEEHGFQPQILTPHAVALLDAHEWPGNIRELKNVIQRAALVAESGTIDAPDLRIHHRHATPGTPSGDAERLYIPIPPEGRSMDEIECEAIRITLELTRGNQSAAARILGISRPTIVRKIRRYGLREIRRETP